MKNLLILIGLPVLLWAILLYPAQRIWGDDALMHSGVALALCLVPAVVTFVATSRLTKTTDQRMLAALGSTGLRMAFVLGIGMILNSQLPEKFPNAFLYWLALFYLVILGLEVGLVVRQLPSEEKTVST